MSIQLENNINNILLSTKLQVVNKYQYIYNNIHNINFIDFMAITNNFILCIYSNYIQQNIDGFLTEIKFVSQYYKKPILGIYITFFKIQSIDENKISYENKKKYNMIINIYNFDINKISNIFMKILYSHNIYCYDSADDVIMIN